MLDNVGGVVKYCLNDWELLDLGFSINVNKTSIVGLLHVVCP